MTIRLTGDCRDIEAGLLNLLQTHPLYCDKDAFVIDVRRLPADGQHAALYGTKGGEFIAYRDKNAFFAALAALIECHGDTDFEAALTPGFGSLCAMVDVSRNAVYTAAELKRFLCRIALCGFTSCMLYMEDVYRLPGYPYFGYMRGSYTDDELRELDAFALTLGIELIPCIQTLAHLRTALRWSEMHELKDTADSLMVGEPGVYKLIDAMLHKLSEVFSSRRIHVGMDEAMGLGAGKFLLKNGYKPPKELMHEHLTQVCGLAAKYGLTPMIWDDMLFRGEGAGQDYYAQGQTLEPGQLDALPDGLQYAYWDYYHFEEQEYTEQLKRRAGLPVSFAGGIWKWTGFAPNYTATRTMTEAALKACMRHGVDEIIVTLWGDDSAEAPLESILPGLLLFGQNRFGISGGYAADALCRVISGSGMSDFLSIEELDDPPGVSRERKPSVNPSKQLLYCDLMMGMFDRHYTHPDIPAHYIKCAKKMSRAAQNAPDGSCRRMFEMYARLAELLAVKAPLGIALRAAYRAGDREALTGLLSRLDACKSAISDFHSAVRSVWVHSCKGPGLEVLDNRLGGLAGRCDTVRERISGWLDGSMPAPDELDIEVLPYDAMPENEHPGYLYFSGIATANTLAFVWLY